MTAKIIDCIKGQYHKHEQSILYVFFGAITTVINTICYVLLYEWLNVNNLISTIVAWVLSVVVAFVTNKIYVFKSQKNKSYEILKEIVSFFACRIMTGVLDTIIMFVAVDWLQQNGIVWKVIVNFLVIIINFFISKFLVFK